MVVAVVRLPSFTFRSVSDPKHSVVQVKFSMYPYVDREDCEVWKSHLKIVELLDAMTRHKARVVLRRVTEGLQSVGDPASAAENNRTVQQLGRNLIPSLMHQKRCNVW